MSNADAVLRFAVGVEEGINELVNGSRLRETLAHGSELEDADLRFFQHFHDPRRAWDRAGLGLGLRFQSSILWGQDAGQEWSWPRVRQHFFDALTGRKKGERDDALARTFRGLGHLVHLVQDAAVPAHTRNDPHVLYSYERLVRDVQRGGGEDSAWFQGLLAQPREPDPGWKALAPHDLAPLPIARLLDTDRYDGTNPDVTTGALIGVAEYANANFFSEDTVFRERAPFDALRIPFPSRASAVEADYAITLRSGQTVTRKYYRKDRDGDTGYRLAAVGFLRDYLQRHNLGSTDLDEKDALDEGVYRDTAERLLPRAVGYSTALLNYFFRGSLGTLGDNLSLAIFSSGEEAAEGALALYYDDIAGERRPVPGATWATSLAPFGIVQDLRFTPPTNPAPKEPDRYLLVFRGTLGGEPSAVVAQQVEIPSVVDVRLVERASGNPYGFVSVRAVERPTEQVIDAAVTSADGRARLRWRPGTTVLHMAGPHAGWPMYWAGGSTFARAATGARLLQAADLDAAGRLEVAVPRIRADWAEVVDACSGFPRFRNDPGVRQSATPLGDGRFDRRSAAYTTVRAVFTRGDTGQEVVLYDRETQPFLVSVDSTFVAEDLNRVGEIAGQILRDVLSDHAREILDADGFLVEGLCSSSQHAVQELPVTIAEF